MIIRPATPMLWAAAAVLSQWAPHAAFSQILFLDDFQDGSVSDGSPVSWTAEPYAQGGTRQVVTGSYILQSPAPFFAMDTDVAGALYRDISLRSQFRINGNNQGVGLYVLSALAGAPGNGNQGQQLFSELDGNVTGDLLIVFFSNGAPTVLAQTNLGFDPTGLDIRMQFDLIGNTATLSAWRDGTPQPASPMLTANVSNLPNLPSQGRIGLYSVPFDQAAVGQTAEFRFFQAVPEPSSLMLLAAGLLGFAVRGRAAEMGSVCKKRQIAKTEKWEGVWACDNWKAGVRVCVRDEVRQAPEQIPRDYRSRSEDEQFIAEEPNRLSLRPVGC